MTLLGQCIGERDGRLCVIITLRRRKQEKVQYGVQFAESTLTSVKELQIYTPYCGLAACLPAQYGNQTNLTKILPRLPVWIMYIRDHYKALSKQG